MLLLAGALIVAAAALVLGTTGALGGPSPSLFQLDGNTVVDQGVPGDDWNSIFSGTNGSFSHTFIPYSSEGPSTDGTAWTPSTKVADPISAWSWQTNTSVINSKGDITDAYAAAYKDSGTSHTIMYFGLDRFDESGDANVGFWFLQDPNFGLNSDGTFSGAHQDGDIFIKSGFLQGGGVAAPEAFVWKNGSLQSLETGALCTAVQQDLCAIDNDGVAPHDGTITVPWTYQDKDGNTADTIAPNGFFEGGFDLTSQFTATDLPCFTHFVAQTATSAGNTETLKDLAAGNVESCGNIELKKHWVGAAGNVTLNIGSGATGAARSDIAATALSGVDGTTGPKQEHVGTYFVSEDVTNPSLYSSTLHCFSDKNENGTQDQGEPDVSTSDAGGGVSSLSLGIGDHIVCTYTNTRNPHLTLQKTVVNDNGGTATAAQWNLSASANGDSNSFSGAGPTQEHDVTAGVTYTLAESGGVSGYAASDWSCDGGTQSGNTITLAAAQNATCTITNDDIAPKLHLRKVVVNDNGGTATTADFTLTADGAGSNDLSGTSPVDSGSGLEADTWTLSETNLAGYSASDWVCVGGTQSTNHITVGVGGEATCTITNDDVAPKLHLRKVVVNDNGGTKTTADFTLTADGTGSNDLSGTSPVDSGSGLKADTWALSETNVAGYTASDWVCVGGSQSGSNITVGVGGEATCTITNDDVAPKLHLRKVVVNDNGGTKTTADFTLTADGTGANDLSGTSPVDSGASLKADTWALSETNVAGYTASDWVCVGGSQSGSNITVGVGGEATCTITNDDNPPALHLRKVVVNDNGGTATTADFTLTADGTGANDLSGTSPVDSGPTLKADTWTLSETSLAGYAASDWVCVGGTQAGNQITVGNGGSATCTITNNDVAPKLHLRKVVVNDNGGTKTTADFTLTADGAGSNDLSGTSPVDSGSGLKADTWTLSETNLAGYTASDWVCVGGTQSTNHITVGVGGEATCTITNDDNAPGLHLRKVVVNDNGGTATTADFTLTADGTGSNDLSGTSPVDSGPGLQADTWTLSETNLAGYSASAWVCVGGTQSTNHITIANGGSATCTITNNDIAPKLHLRKVVVNNNGGTKTTADFTLTANGTGSNDLSGPSPVDSGAGLQADTWALSETNVAGYTASAWDCVGGSQSGSNITVGIGGEATCTITNDDNPPELHLRKVVVNDNGGTATTADFTLTADGTGSNDLSGKSPVDSGPGLQADTWTLSETNLAGYAASDWVCVGGTQSTNHITVGNGQSATCTITNNDVAPKLHLRKVVVNDNGGTKTTDDFTLTADGTGANDLSGTSPVDSGAGLKADTWALSETSLPGYSASSWSCVGGSQEGSNITVGVGGEATCTITNNDIPPVLHLRKVVVNDDGGTATTDDFTLTADGTGSNDLSGKSPVDSGAGLQADTWALSETNLPGYTASDWSCEGGSQDGSNITVGVGGEATCTITNDDIAPTITVTKRILPAGDTGKFNFTIDADSESQQVLDNGTDGYGNGDSTGAVDVSAGDHTISESGNGNTKLSDYASTWSCSSNKERSESGTGTSISLDGLTLTENVTCTFTNTRLATLVVVKKVDNSNGGGSKGPGDFTIHATAAGLELPGSPAAGSSTGTTYSGLMPGTYKVSEDAVSGYSLTSITGCLADGSVVLEAGQTVTCTLTNTSAAPPPPPPPPPPAPKIDLAITKTGTPNPVTTGKQITWTMVVTNNGPNGATGVTVADPVPAGTTFVSVATSQGSCTGGAAVSCQLGSMPVGSSVTITLVTTANTVGTLTNTATTVGNEQETNTANNTASASVVAQGPFVPPVRFCTAVRVSPKTLFVGRKVKLTMRITQNGKPVKGIRIKIKGATLHVTTKKSNAKGMVTVTVKPRRAGIVTFVPVSHKGCTNPRIGVTGVFTPPVTG